MRRNLILNPSDPWRGQRPVTRQRADRPRVLHVFKTALPETAGGVLTVMSDIAKGLEDRFDSRFLIASNRPKDYFERAIGTPVETVRHFGYLLSLPIAPTFPLRLARSARDVDIIALHSPYPLADLASYLGAFDRAGLVVHWHSEIVQQSGFRMLYRPPVRRTLAKASRIIVSGERLVATSPFLGPLREKCTVVPFGVDFEFWNRLDDADRAAVAAIRSAHPRLILAVGRLISYKGFHVLLESMAKVRGELWIVGSGKLESLLRRRAEEAGVLDRVRFLGTIPNEELRRIYHGASVFAFPSITRAETFGIVQLEAMACGLPIVNTRLETIVPEVARDGQEALTVEPHEPEALARALNRLLDDDPLRARLGAAGRERARRDFRREDFLAGIADVYAASLT